MRSGTIFAADLFAGAGGTSTGLILACQQMGKRIDLTAINHWQKAIETSSDDYGKLENHQRFTHRLSDHSQFEVRRVQRE